MWPCAGLAARPWRRDGRLPPAMRALISRAAIPAGRLPIFAPDRSRSLASRSRLRRREVRSSRLHCLESGAPVSASIRVRKSAPPARAGGAVDHRAHSRRSGDRSRQPGTLRRDASRKGRKTDPRLASRPGSAMLPTSPARSARATPAEVAASTAWLADRSCRAVDQAEEPDRPLLGASPPRCPTGGPARRPEVAAVAQTIEQRLRARQVGNPALGGSWRILHARPPTGAIHAQGVGIRALRTPRLRTRGGGRVRWQPNPTATTGGR